MEANRKRGAVLAVAMILMVALTIMGMGLMELALSDAREASRACDEAGAFWAAEAGLNHARALGVKNAVPYEHMNCLGCNAIAGAAGDCGYEVDVLYRPGFPTSGAIRRYVIVSRGRAPGGSVRTVRMFATIETFASYMHASRYETTTGGSPIWFTTGDVLDGMVYLNDTINVNGYPRFLQLTRSAAPSARYQNGGSVAAFEGGLSLNAPALDFDQYRDHVAALRGKALASGLVLSGGDYDLSFQADGTVTYWQTGQTAAVTRTLSSCNGVIFVDGHVHIRPAAGLTRSLVNGCITVGSGREIFIDGHVTYASAEGLNVFDPAFAPEGVLDDSLGLVARDGVWVNTSSEIFIHAAVLVTQGDNGFSATYRYQAIGTPRINLFGSISQYRRGVVGQVPSNGFRKNYRYDVRFLGQPPPHFPYSAYRFSDWSESG